MSADSMSCDGDMVFLVFVNYCMIEYPGGVIHDMAQLKSIRDIGI